MRQLEKIKYMLTTELTEDELKNVIHYSFSNRPNFNTYGYFFNSLYS